MKPSPQSSHVPSKIGDDDHSFIHRLKNPSLYSVRKRVFKVKGTFPSKITWSGTIEKFPAYKDAIEGFYAQEHVSYLFNDEFQDLYMKYGDNVMHHFIDPEYEDLTIQSIKETSQHLYGTLQMSCRTSNTAKRFLRSNKPKRDGIRAWIQLCNNQDNDGNVDVKKQRYEAQTRKPYSKGHKGGLIAYLDEVAEGFAGLEEHGCVYTEEQKMTTLLSNLHLEPNDAYLLTYCRDTFTNFEACYQY